MPSSADETNENKTAASLFATFICMNREFVFDGALSIHVWRSHMWRAGVCHCFIRNDCIICFVTGRERIINLLIWHACTRAASLCGIFRLDGRLRNYIRGNCSKDHACHCLPVQSIKSAFQMSTRFDNCVISCSSLSQISLPALLSTSLHSYGNFTTSHCCALNLNWTKHIKIIFSYRALRRSWDQKQEISFIIYFSRAAPAMQEMQTRYNVTRIWRSEFSEWVMERRAIN
jgi:hypothetical protein